MAPSAGSSLRKTRRRVIVIGCLVVVLSVSVLVYRSGAVVCTPSGTTTAILQLCQPASGETGWATAINNNWAILDGLFNPDGTLKQVHGGTGQVNYTAFPQSIQLFTATGTFSVPVGITKIWVQAWGGGGGGGGSCSYDG